MERLFFAVLGGGLIVYGFIQRNKWVDSGEQDAVMKIVAKDEASQYTGAR